MAGRGADLLLKHLRGVLDPARNEAGSDGQLLARWAADVNKLYRDEPGMHELDCDPAGFSWVDANDADNCIITMLRRAREGAPLRVIADQTGSPTWTGDLASALTRLVDRGTPGTYHLVNSSEFSTNAQPPYPFEFSLPNEIRVVGQGNVPNFYATVHFKGTINANGDTTVAFFDASSRCQ